VNYVVDRIGPRKEKTEKDWYRKENYSVCWWRTRLKEKRKEADHITRLNIRDRVCFLSIESVDDKKKVKVMKGEHVDRWRE
jgi:hypothetical protein